MKNHISIVIYIVLCLGLSCTSPKQIKNGWENEYLGKTKGQLFYSENYANYWSFTIDPQKHKNLGFIITGQKPNARYMSLNLYAHDTKKSIGSLIDNSLLNEADTFSASFLPKGTKSTSHNTLYFDLTRGKHSIFLRYYDPNENEFGGVSLPKIQAIDLTTNEIVPLPHLRFNVFSAKSLHKIATKFIAIKNSKKPYNNQDRLSIHAYKFSGAGYYPNNDNLYLIVPIEKQQNEVAIIRFKPPTFSLIPQDTLKDVRYWSLAFGLLDTQNPYTLIDRKAKIAADGYIYVALGNQVNTSDKTIYNHIPWLTKKKKIVLLYRNLLTNPNYPYTFEQCVEIDWEDKTRRRASLKIGDYAPQGKIISIKEFEQNGFLSLK